METIAERMYKLLILVVMLQNPLFGLAEDDYTMQTDGLYDEYTGVQVDETRRMWIKSKWIRSYELKNWSEDIDDAQKAAKGVYSASTLFVRNGIIYVHGSYDDTTKKCSFLRYDAKTGEELSPIDIDFSNVEHRPIYGFISLREDNVGTVYLISACSYKDPLISFHIIDLDNRSVLRSYTTDVSSLITESTLTQTIGYPIVFGNLQTGDFSVCAVASVTSTSDNKLFNAVYNEYILESSKIYSLSNFSTNFSQYASIVYYDNNSVIIDTDLSAPICYTFSNDKYVVTKIDISDKLYPFTQDNVRSLGAHFFERSGVKMVVYSPVYKRNEAHYYRIMFINDDDPTKWIYSDAYSTTATGNVFKMWDTPNFATLTDINLIYIRNTLGYTIHNGGDTDLYLYTSGLGLAAYNIIGPGTTTEEDAMGISPSYSINNNVISTNVPCDIIVYNIHGEKVLSKLNTSNISLTDLRKGIYIVKMSNQLEAIKMVVK